MSSLTAQQEALLPAISDEWLRVGLCTNPADRPASEQGTRAAYRATPGYEIAPCGIDDRRGTGS